MDASVRTYDVVIPLVTLNPSGGVRMVLQLANTMAARGKSVIVTAPADAPSPPIPLHEGVVVARRSGGRGLRGRAAFVSEMPRARVYVATGYQTPLLIRAATNGREARVLYLIQNDEPASHVTFGSQPEWTKPALRALARLGYRVPATRIAVSRFVAERAGADRIHHVVPPGIDPEFSEIAARADDTFRVRRWALEPRLMVGTFAHPGRVKAMADATAAFALANAGNAMFVAFDGAHPTPLPDFVEPFSRVAARANLAHDIPTFLSSIDVFVFPSLVEGFGLPPLEAMACGAAVVLTDSGGVREYARDDSNCLLVPPGDAPAIARAVERLTTARGAAELRMRLAREGRATALQFPVERFANACADVVEQLLS